MINCVSITLSRGDSACGIAMKFAIVCDSSADLPESLTQEMQVRVVPFYVSMDSENYLKEGVDIPVMDFYRTMVEHDGCYPRTSMPTIKDYMEAFLPYVQAGMPVLCICLTQKFSGSYQSAVNARSALLADHPEAQIHVMDSRLVTALEGLFVKEAVRLRDLDLTLDKAVPLLEEIRSTGYIFFTTKDLKYLEHGGRLGHVASIAGSVLDLKPILCFHDGELDTTRVCRGRKRSVQQVIEKFFAFVKEHDLRLEEYLFGTGIGLDVPDYESFQQTLQQRFEQDGIHPHSWTRMQIGATIGVHTGPYPMGLGILKRCAV